MVDVLLINPGEISPYPAMGLAELAAFIREKGYSVKIVDFSAPVSVTEIFKNKAKIVGISVPCGLVEASFKLAEQVKREMDSVVVFGGYYPTFCYKECLQERNIDFVVLGEGEIPLLSLCDNLLRKVGDFSQIPGIAYKKGKKIVANAATYILDLNSLPIPAFDLLPLNSYPKKIAKESIITISTGRGCSFGCKFCSQSAFWQKMVRFKNPQKVLEIIDLLVEKYSVTYIRILDDIFPLRPKEALQISRGLNKRGLKWECQARIDVISEDLLQEFANNNLDRIFFGIESGSPKIQKFLGKKFNPFLVKSIIGKAHSRGIKTKVSFQVGTPGETKQDIDLSIKLANELDVDEIALFISTPFPGTPLHRIVSERGLLITFNPDEYDPSIVNMGTGYLSVEEVEKEAQRFLENVRVATWGHHSVKGRMLRELE